MAWCVADGLLMSLSDCVDVPLWRVRVGFELCAPHWVMPEQYQKDFDMKKTNPAGERLALLLIILGIVKEILQILSIALNYETHANRELSSLPV